MAILQAARATALGLPEDSAYSWGLNRSIFYAAAKRGFKGKPSIGGPRGKLSKEKELAGQPEEYFLGDEKAYLDEKSTKKEPIFEIGGEAQTPEDFGKQIVSRFGSETNFRRAWNEALKIVKSYDDNTLKSQHEFYEMVYKPRRDDLSKEWNELFAEKATTGKSKSSPR